MPFGGQPATLWILHAPVMPQRTTAHQPLRLHEFNLSNPDTNVVELCKELGISRQILYRHLSPGRRSTTWRGAGARPQVGTRRGCIVDPAAITYMAAVWGSSSRSVASAAGSGSPYLSHRNRVWQYLWASAATLPRTAEFIPAPMRTPTNGTTLATF